MLDEKDSDECTIRFLTNFENAIQSSEAIDPGKRAFDLPPLTTVTFPVSFFDRQRGRINLAIAAI